MDNSVCGGRIDYILRFFPSLSEVQRSRFCEMISLYPVWNDKINVISRRDIENLEVNHVLHSLAVAKFVSFKPGTRVLDLGTGGGFPGIPLAVFFPEVRFHLVDRIGKKLKVARDVAERLGLDNVSFQHGDVGECRGEFDFVVSRAVMNFPDLLRVSRRLICRDGFNAVPNGLIALKGGNLDAELGSLRGRCEVLNIHDWFDLPFFETKKLVYYF